MLLTWFYLFSAEAARKNFDAERGLAREIVQDLGVVPEDQEIDPHTLSDEEVEHIEEEDFCSIPKKPLYDFDDTPETFQQKEIDSFWKWKRTLSRLQAKNPKVTIMTKLCPSKFTLIYSEEDFTGQKIIPVWYTNKITIIDFTIYTWFFLVKLKIVVHRPTLL